MNNKIISGALFDFMGWLTSRPKRIMLSSADDASPAVDAIKYFAKMRGLSLDDARVQDWQEALAEQPAQQEPVATVTSETGADISMSWWHEPALPIGTKLYTSPPAQRTWVSLTDEERDDLLDNYITAEWRARAIEAKLKEKNT